MICDPCAAHADSEKNHTLDDDLGIRCEYCWEPVRLTRKGKAKGHVAYDYASGRYVDCRGGGTEPVYIGHAYCRGCDCHHNPVGTGIPHEG